MIIVTGANLEFSNMVAEDVLRRFRVGCWLLRCPSVAYAIIAGLYSEAREASWRSVDLRLEILSLGLTGKSLFMDRMVVRFSSSSLVAGPGTLVRAGCRGNIPNFVKESFLRSCPSSLASPPFLDVADDGRDSIPFFLFCIFDLCPSFP